MVLQQATPADENGAAVQLKPRAIATPAELRAFARERVAAYKYPRHVWLVAELPRNATGKVMKHKLREQAAPA
jgi:long-chain acyl-CoA synthetase